MRFFLLFLFVLKYKNNEVKIIIQFPFSGEWGGERKGGGGGGDMRSEEHFNMSSAGDIQQLICFSETSLRVKASNSRESPI